MLTRIRPNGPFKTGRQKTVYVTTLWIRYWVWPAVAALVFFYYALLLTNGDFNLFASEELGLTFNAMALGLLKGDFSISPDIIGNEAFVHDGKTFTYFGVFPALLRLPLAPFVNLDATYLSRLSCLAASSLATVTSSAHYLAALRRFSRVAKCM